MSSTQRRAQKRKEQDEWERQQAQKRDEQRAQQKACSHYNCTVIRSNWQGQPVEVFCEDCEATNYLEHNDL